MDRPAAARQGDAERRPDRAGPDDADDRRLARPGVEVRVDVIARVDLVAVAVGARRDGIEVDAGRLDGSLGLGTVALGVVAREIAPRPHRARAEVIGRSCRGSTRRV
jgi:hypothetical protein